MTWQPTLLKHVARFGYGDALPMHDGDTVGPIQVFGSNGAYSRFSEANTKSPVIIVGRKGSYGKVNWSDEPVFASDTTFYIDSTTTHQHLRWLFYALQTLQLDEGSNEAAVPGLSREYAYAKRVALPSLSHQRAIADFLDCETAGIDALIARKRRLLDLLAEKRQALITQAVTKGLDPAVPMRDSGIEMRELPERFASGEYQVLLVADKYQTGFDQPLLHSMYVDKRLSGIQAVQTLSRLNRIHPLKEDTFVLDFINEREEIRDAFKQFYEGAEIGEEADPAQLYRIKADLDEKGIYQDDEIERFCAVYYQPKQRQSAQDHRAMNATLDPAVERFVALRRTAPEEAELWYGQLTSFRNLYGFLSQVIPYQDSDLERLYVFLRHLMAKIPRRSTRTQYDFDDDVSLEYYRLQKISEGSIDLRAGVAPRLDGPKEVGTGDVSDSAVALSQVIQIINERFGTEFNQSDQLFFDQLVEVAASSDELKQSARVNSEEKFTLLFQRLLESLFIERMDQNELIFARYMNDVAFQKLVSDLLGQQVYRRLAEDG